MSLQQALAHQNMQAFLRVIRAGESSQDASAYRVMFGGAMVDSLERHPNVRNTAAGLTSTAAGAYQFLYRTWEECRAALNLPDFGPGSQDLAAVYLIRRRGALDDVIAGRLDAALAKCAREWASLPGSPYGQPTMTMDKARAVFAQYGGSASSQTPSQEAKMAPFLIPAAVEMAKLIPKLGALFGGSETAQRNTKAAEVVVEAVVGAVGAANAQDAVERISTDPAARDAAARAVESVWYQITEAGGGGIDGARKADRAAAQAGDMLRSPSFWVTLALLPLVYLVVGSVVGLWGAEWPSDVRAAIATAVVSLVVGGAAGYYWGQTTSRNRAP